MDGEYFCGETMSMRLLLRWVSIFAIAVYTSPALGQSGTALRDSTGRIFLYGLQLGSRVGVGITRD